MTVTKERRQRAIVDLVRSRSLHTQHDLAEALAGVGLAATQATVSRDIQELGLVRTSAGYRPPAPPAALAAYVRSFKVVRLLAVIQTLSGSANLVAQAIDDAAVAGVAGTLAGDNTIIAVLEHDEGAARLKEMLGV